MERAKAIRRGEYEGHHKLCEKERRKYLSDGDDD